MDSGRRESIADRRKEEAMSDKKRKYYRKCGRCGERYEQSEMIRTNYSATGWICRDCQAEEHPEYETDEW